MNSTGRFFLFLMALAILALALLTGCGDLQKDPVKIKVTVEGFVELRMERDTLIKKNKKLKAELKACKKKKNVCVLWGRPCQIVTIPSLL